MCLLKMWPGISQECRVLTPTVIFLNVIEIPEIRPMKVYILRLGLSLVMIYIKEIKLVYLCLQMQIVYAFSLF